jgi:predicted Zn-dependent peptidase
MAVAKTASHEEIVASWESGFVPEGSILALAGDVDANAVIRRLDALLGGWRCGRSEPVVTSAPTGGHGHVSRDSTQVHIGLAWPAPSAGSDDSTLERVATRILGGSTSGRLFTEVRQRRSLCYTVSASYRARRDDGDITLYAGTTAERAVETLEVCEAQINRMKDGVSIDEFTRAMAGLRGSTVFNGERTQARAAAMVTDQYNLGAARSMEDRLAQLDSVTLDDLNAYLTGRVDPVPTIVTVGPELLRPDFEEEPPLCHPSP